MEKTAFQIGFEKRAGRVAALGKLLADEAGALGKKIEEHAASLSGKGQNIAKAVEESGPYKKYVPPKIIHGSGKNMPLYRPN